MQRLLASSCKRAIFRAFFIYLEMYFCRRIHHIHLLIPNNLTHLMYSQTFLGGDLASSSQTVGKHDLSIAPILLIFIYLEMYFLSLNLPCKCNESWQKMANPPKVLSWIVKTLWANNFAWELYSDYLWYYKENSALKNTLIFFNFVSNITK